MKKYVLSIALLVASTGIFAQNRVVKKALGLVNQVTTAISEGKPMDTAALDQAQGFLTEAFNSGETKDMALAWNVQGNVYQLIFSDELNKAAAQQPLDTAKFAKNLFACIDAYEKCYENDEKQTYTEENKAKLKQYRLFVYYAGVFNLQNGKSKEAYDAFDKWMKYPEEIKALAGDPSLQNDSTVNKAEVAYYACLSAYQSGEYDKVGTYMDEALKYDKEAKTVRQLHLKALEESGDTAQWVTVSRQYGAEDETTAQNLIAYYLKKNDNAGALSFAEELIAKNPNSTLANYAKGVVFFGQKKYEEALPFFVKALEIDPEYTDAYYNAGVCCCNVGSGINDKISTMKFKTQADYDKEINKVKDWYRKAEPYFLKMRELVPDEPNRWAYNLKQIYYVTGDKEKEAEMDIYLK